MKNDYRGVVKSIESFGDRTSKKVSCWGRGAAPCPNSYQVCRHDQSSIRVALSGPCHISRSRRTSSSSNWSEYGDPPLVVEHSRRHCIWLRRHLVEASCYTRQSIFLLLQVTIITIQYRHLSVTFLSLCVSSSCYWFYPIGSRYSYAQELSMPACPLRRFQSPRPTLRNCLWHAPSRKGHKEDTRQRWVGRVGVPRKSHHAPWTWWRRQWIERCTNTLVCIA